MQPCLRYFGLLDINGNLLWEFKRGFLTSSNKMIDADLDNDGRDELLITSPWGIGILEWNGSRLTSAMLAPNGTRFGGWLLNTADNKFKVRRNISGSRRGEIMVESPWGIGLMRLQGSTLQVPFMTPNGTRLGGWLLNTKDNLFH